MRNIAIGNFSNTGLGTGNVVIGNGACLTEECNTLLIDLDQVSIKAQMSPTQAKMLNELLITIFNQNPEGIYISDPLLN